MPGGRAASRQKSHGERRGVYYAYTPFLEISEIIRKRVVVQAIVAETQDALDSTCGHPVYHPFEIGELESRYAYVTHHSLLLERNQGRQGLVHDLLKVGKLDVVDIDEVYEVHVEPFHAFVHAFFRPFGRIIPAVDAVFPVTPDLGGKIVFVPGDLLQGQAEHMLGLGVAVIRRHVHEVDAQFDRLEDGFDALPFGEAVEDTPK